MATKTCAKCGEAKPVARFLPSVATPDGLKRICAPCYFARNHGRRPPGFQYVVPPGAFKAWITHGTLLDLEVRVTIAEAVPVPGDPTRIELLPAEWGTEGARYVTPDWHASEAAARREAQRLVDEVVEDRRRAFMEICAVRGKVRSGESIRFDLR